MRWTELSTSCGGRSNGWWSPPSGVQTGLACALRRQPNGRVSGPIPSYPPRRWTTSKEHLPQPLGEGSDLFRPGLTRAFPSRPSADRKINVAGASGLWGSARVDERSRGEAVAAAYADVRTLGVDRDRFAGENRRRSEAFDEQPNT